MTDDTRPNTGVVHPDYGLRFPTPWGRTGTHRDVIEARDHLRSMVEEPGAVAALRRSHYQLWAERPGATLVDLEAKWTLTLGCCQAAVMGSLVWISEDVCQGVDFAADKYPEPTAGYRDRIDLPSAGIALAQSPLFARVMQDGELAVHTSGLAVAGIMWSTWGEYHKGDGRASTGGLVVTPFVNSESMAVDSRKAAVAKSWPLMPMGPAFLPGEPPYADKFVTLAGDAPGIAEWSGSGFHWPRFFLSLDAWTSQVAEVEDTEVRAPRMQRSGKGKAKRPPKVGDVKVVKLRRAAGSRSSDSPSGEGSARTYSHRWIVGGDTGGFWRQQPCGPRQSERRPVWISPYVKGPEGAPLLHRETVIKVDR